MGKIITVGREFGSGGREIGRKLAENSGLLIMTTKSLLRLPNVLLLQLNTYKVLRKTSVSAYEYYNRAYFLGFAESGNGSAA